MNKSKNPLNSIIEFSEELKKFGVTKEAANVIAERFEQLEKGLISDPATKQDIVMVKGDIAEVKKDIELTKKDIIIKLGTFMVLTAITTAGFICWYFEKVLSLRLPH